LRRIALAVALLVVGAFVLSTSGARAEPAPPPTWPENRDTPLGANDWHCKPSACSPSPSSASTEVDPMLDAPLLDKVALVTGGSRGLGKEMVLAFAEAGADVVIASRKREACQALADEVASRTGRQALAVAANVSAWDDCDALAAAAYDRFGHVDVLVNNAGLSPLYPSLPEVTEALYDKVLHVNLRGPFRLTSLVGTRMAADRGGSIINISSVEAVRPTATALPYAAAKAGLEALTHGFAQAFAPSVRVNTIECGMFRTDISKAWGDPELVDAMAQRTLLLQRVGEPHEVVGAALFLATDASSYCTGATLRIDGGVR
jgi:NAD(P)-dependent dehydrogenase (short-subunit alcohol dehydrogenase family)